MPPVENYLCDIRDSLTASRAGWAFPDRMQKGPALAGPFFDYRRSFELVSSPWLHLQPAALSDPARLRIRLYHLRREI